MITPHDHHNQLELSRAAAERSALTRALAERPSQRTSAPVTRRLRHALAVRLITTARVIDAH